MGMADKKRISGRMLAALTALLGCLLVAAFADLSAVSSSVAIDVRPAELVAAPPGANWLSYNGDFTGRRFSGLSPAEV